MFLRIFQHLLPDAAAWRLTIEKRLREFFEGLSQEPAAIRAFVDDVHEDLRPETTRPLAEWEAQYALASTGSDAVRRQRLDAAWKATGGQSPRYLQDSIQAAGFDLYVHEWWSSGPAPYVARDPRSYTTQPLIGTFQCGKAGSVCGGARVPQTAKCNRFLVNDTHYLVNENLTPTAPPPVPDDPARWPFFVYIGGATFGTVVAIDPTRRFELEELLLKLCPQHLWIVTLITYATPSGLPWTLLEDPGTDWSLLEAPGTAWTTA